jgi:hypothetical protein
MIWDHTRTERGICVACWSGFPAGCTSIRITMTRIWVTAYLLAIITCLTTLAYLSSGLSGLKFN